jgi:transposase-like protein
MAKMRRTFTPEFKAVAYKLVTEPGRSFAEVARDQNIGESTLWSERQVIAAIGERAFPGNPAGHGGGAAPPLGGEQATTGWNAAC